MSVNIKQGSLGAPVNSIRCIPTAPSAIVAGAACRFGNTPGVAHDAEDANGFCTMLLRVVAELSVVGVNSGGNSAVAPGDLLYLQSSGQVDKDSGGVFYGTALGAVLGENVSTNTRTGTIVVSGATTTIRVLVGN